KIIGIANLETFMLLYEIMANSHLQKEIIKATTNKIIGNPECIARLNNHTYINFFLLSEILKQKNFSKINIKAIIYNDISLEFIKVLKLCSEQAQNIVNPKELTANNLRLFAATADVTSFKQLLTIIPDEQACTLIKSKYFNITMLTSSSEAWQQCAEEYITTHQQKQDSVTSCKQFLSCQQLLCSYQLKPDDVKNIPETIAKLFYFYIYPPGVKTFFAQFTRNHIVKAKQIHNSLINTNKQLTLESIKELVEKSNLHSSNSAKFSAFEQTRQAALTLIAISQQTLSKQDTYIETTISSFEPNSIPIQFLPFSIYQKSF
ncbi:MAG: hypothetical protein AAGG80_06870, partial [Pseudomonadota bacterium]